MIGRSTLESAFSDVAEQVVLEAGRRAGVGIRIERFPLARSIEMAKSGEIDGDTARTAEVVERYPGLIVLKPAVIPADSAIYGRDPALAQRTRAEIHRMTACVARGRGVLAKHAEGMTVVESPTREASLAMLGAERCDVALVLALDAEASREKLGLTKLVRWPYRWASDPLYMVLNPKQAALAPSLSQALASMQADGTTERYYTEALRRNRVQALGPEPAR